MPTIDHLAQAADRKRAMQPDAEATLFASLEFSLTSWVVVASAPGQDGSATAAAGSSASPLLHSRASCLWRFVAHGLVPTGAVLKSV